MLNEFNKQLDELFKHYSKNKLSIKQLIFLLNHLKRVWSSCRLDLKNFGIESNDVEFMEDNNNLYISSPAWFNDEEGAGYKITSNISKFNVPVKCINKGTLRMYLRGSDYKILKKRKPIFINFKKVLVNDEKILDEDTLLWHDKPYSHNIKCEDNEEIMIGVEFKSIFDYFPQLRSMFVEVKNAKDVEVIRNMHSLITNYLKCESIISQFDEINNPPEVLYDFYKKNNLINDSNRKFFKSYDSFHDFYMNYNQNEGLEVNHLINKLNNRIDDLENKLLEFEEETTSYLDSNNLLFNNILVDHRLQSASVLNRLQTLCSELLLFFSNICSKHEIQWWLDYGTLMGSIRHEGFIPWDDDLDVGMMREDYHRFIDVMYDEIEEHGLSDVIQVVYRFRKYRDIEVNSFIQFFVKDKQLGRRKIMAGLDVFPYDFMESYDESTFGDKYNQAKRNFYRKLSTGDNTKAVYMGLEYDDVLDEYYENLNLSYDECKYVIPGVEGAFGYHGTNIYELSVYEYDEMLPLKENKFENHVYPVLNNSDSYLTKVYGDYLTVPKNIRVHGRVDDFRGIPDINNIFEEYITIFKHVNEDF